DKAAAFSQFFRVLRPGGRISLFEPINRVGLCDRRLFGYDLGPAGAIGEKILRLYRDLQPPESDPMVDFDERDLVRLCEEAGFFPIDLRYQVEIAPTEPAAWNAVVNM